MPVPRLFDVPPLPREQWMHVVATLLGLTQADTRAAFLAELTGDEVAGAADAQVSERRPLVAGDQAPVVADVVVRSGKQWGIAVQGCLGFDIDRAAMWQGIHDALAANVEKAMLVAITPDRKPPADVVAASEGRTIVHRSWQRVRDWVQERPERGGVTGTDAFLLREADYFLSPRVAELYRLENLIVHVDPAARASVMSLYMDLNDICPQPTIRNTSDTAGVIEYPRGGDPLVSVALGDGGAPQVAAPGGDDLTLASRNTYVEARSGLIDRARAALPPRR